MILKVVCFFGEQDFLFSDEIKRTLKIWPKIMGTQTESKEPKKYGLKLWVL